MIITDAQVHIWEEDSPEHPWGPGGRERARQHGLGPLRSDQVLRLMDGAGVQRAVLVPPTFSGARNDVCLEAARACPSRLAVMGYVAADRPDVADVLAGWRSQPGMLGIRLTLSRGASQGWIADGTLDPFWKAAEENGIPLYVLPPDLHEQLGEVAQRHPGLRIIVDHLGIRTGARDMAILPGIEALLALASLSNVAVKATCLPSYVSEPYPYRGLQEVVRRVIGAFGPERVFWGSDMSRLPGPYRDAVTFFTEEMPFLSAEELEWIMGRGLSEWLAWPA